MPSSLRGSGMPRESVQLSGFPELKAALFELGKSTGKNVLRRVGREMLRPMHEDAKAGARRRSGDLEKSIIIGTRLAPSQRGSINRAVGGGQFRADASNSVNLYMGPGQNPQAITEEFGKYNQSPHPYMRPAFDTHASPAIHRAGQLLWDAVSKAAARKAKKAAKAALL